MISPRFSGLVAFAAVLGAALPWLPGCIPPAESHNSAGGQSGDGAGGADPPAARSGAGHDLPHSPGAELEPLKFKQWPRPAAALLLSGEQFGYFEPCGCTEGQSGGLARRDDLLRQIQALQWPVAALDLGGIVRDNRRQSQIKFEVLLAALKDMRYEALGLGPQELRFGPEYLLSQHVVDPQQPQAAVWFLAANVVLFDSPELGTPARWKRFRVGETTVAVTAVVGKRLAETELLHRSGAELRIEEPQTALAEVVRQFQAEPADLLVLLAHTSAEEARELVRAFPQFQLVVSAGGPEDPRDQPEFIGQSMLVHVGQKGKYTGVAGFYPEDAGRPLRFELVQLNRERFADSPRMVDHMRFYQERLFKERTAAEEPPIEHPGGALYVGAEKCGECHTRAYEIWKNTPHAHAFESLDPAHQRHGYERLRGVSRVFDAECLCCHTTGWEPQKVLRYKGGFLNQEFARTDMEKAAARLLQGSGCENCHGPGSRHVELIEQFFDDGSDRTLAAARKEVHVSLETARQSLCFSCHDLDNSPNFEFKAYWEKVKHYGLD